MQSLSLSSNSIWHISSNKMTYIWTTAHCPVTTWHIWLTSCLALDTSSSCCCNSCTSISMAFFALTAAADVNSASSNCPKTRECVNKKLLTNFLRVLFFAFFRLSICVLVMKLHQQNWRLTQQQLAGSKWRQCTCTTLYWLCISQCRQEMIKLYQQKPFFIWRVSAQNYLDEQQRWIKHKITADLRTN